MSVPKLRLVVLTAGPLVILIAIAAGCLAVSPARLGVEEPVRPEAKEPKLKELLKERLATVRDIAKNATEKYKNGVGSYDQVMEANRLVLEAKLELCDSDKERIAVLEKFVEEAKKQEANAAHFAKTGQGLTSTALKATAERLQAEIALERARAKGTAQPGDGNTDQDLQDQVALTEMQVAIKRAGVTVAEAQKNVAVAMLATNKARVDEARALESYAEKKFRRIEQLGKQKSVEDRLVDEQRDQWDAAKARLTTAQGDVSEWEGRVGLEQARVKVAQLELQEAELRLKQMKARLRLPPGQGSSGGPAKAEPEGARRQDFWIDPSSGNQYFVGVAYPAASGP